MRIRVLRFGYPLQVLEVPDGTTANEVSRVVLGGDCDGWGVLVNGEVVSPDPWALNAAAPTHFPLAAAPAEHTADLVHDWGRALSPERQERLTSAVEDAVHSYEIDLAGITWRGRRKAYVEMVFDGPPSRFGSFEARLPATESGSDAEWIAVLSEAILQFAEDNHLGIFDDCGVSQVLAAAGGEGMLYSEGCVYEEDTPAMDGDSSAAGRIAEFWL